MAPEIWKRFFETCCEVLGVGSHVAMRSDNWCSWTTYDRLTLDAEYWSSGLPTAKEIGDIGIGDGGVWGQPFSYSQIAHLIVPRKFYWESFESGEFRDGFKEEPLESLSKVLETKDVPHRLTDLVLEIKCY
ncbi:hypothetical protein EZI54_22735 [Marinobacter halodurans]|uniref:DUF2591 domain-containing protein n=1 Tax=Marinobacter halodurans TaxID=2528979 RepID=A0ABY1ZHK3_9GAMM|nr:hypothetical protein EZI54_22735 [Marinobacter halodurans]